MSFKWELVLIEWVNCLNMSSHIEKLESLLDGQFLSNFMNAHVRTQLSLPSIIPHIKSFIETEYPSLNFNLSLSSENVSDLTAHELMPLLSILMHHSCIINPRDIFTSPMCYHISKESQIYIKRFLEEMNSAIGDINLIEVINNCLSIEESSSINQWIPSAGDSPLNLHTPLKEYLQTPFKSRFLTEKEYEIKKLRTCLELESFEKTDVMEELKEHKEKIGHLKQLLKGKSQEVLKLKNELFDAERQNSPLSVKKKYDLNRQLRSEIADLEKYVSQLQAEQEVLQAEKDSSNRKLKKAETQLTAANEKIYSLEVVCDQLTDKHHVEQHELATLRSNCSELNQLLSELRGSNHNNSSILDLSQDNVTSSSSKRRSRNLNDTASCEDLACSVIEVQLRDAQEENLNLKQQLKETVNTNNSITIEIDKLRLNYDELRKNLEESEEDKTKLNLKFEELKASFIDLQLNRQELLQKFNCVTEEKCLFANEIHSLTKKNTDISVKLQQSICEVDVLEHKLAEAKFVEEVFKNLNDAQMKQICKLETESSHLEQGLNQKISDLSEANCKINSLEQQFDSLDSKFDSNLKKLEQMLRGTVLDGYTDKNEVFECLLNEFEVKERNEFDNNEQLRLRLHDFELDIDALQKKIDDLKLKELTDFEFSSKLQESLKQAELKHEILDKAINEKDGTIGKLKQDLNELEVTVSDLQDLKMKFAQQESEIHLRDYIAESLLLNFVQDLQNVNKILESKTLIPLREISEDSNDVENNQDMKRIKAIWTENDKLFLKETAKINDNIAAIISELQEKTIELKDCTEELKLKGLEFQRLEQVFKDATNDYEASVMDSETRIQLIEKAKIKLEEEICQQSQINHLQVQEIDQLSEKYKKLAQEKETYATKSEALKNDVKTLAEKVIIFDKLCEEKDDVLAKTSQELLAWKLEYESKKRDIVEMKEELSRSYSEIGSIKSEMLDRKKENEDHKTNIDILKKEVQFLETLADDLTTKNLDLGANNLHIIQQLSMKNKECNEFIEEIRKCKQKKEFEISNLKEDLEKSKFELLDLNEKYDKASLKHDNEIESLTLEKAQLNDQILNLESMEKDYIKDIKLIKVNVAQLVKSILNFAKQDKVPLINSTDLINRHENLTMEDLDQVFQELHTVFRLLHTRKDDLERNIDIHLLELKEFRERESTYQENLESKEIALTKVIDEIRNLEKDSSQKQKENETNLDSKMCELSYLRTEIQELKQTLSKGEEEYKALLDTKENEVAKLQNDLETFEEVFSIYKQDTEEIYKCNDDLKHKLSYICEEYGDKAILCDTQIQLLNEKCDNLNAKCQVFEEIIAGKAKLEENLNDKQVVIEDLTTNLNFTQNNYEFTNNQLKELENQLAQKVSEFSTISAEKSALSIKLIELENGLKKSKHDRDALLDSHRKIMEDSEISMRNVHESAVNLKKDLEERLKEAQTEVLDSKTIQKEIEEALFQEKTTKEALELTILDLKDEKVKLEQVKFRYQCLIITLNEALPENVKLNVPDEYANDFVALQDLSIQIESHIVDIIDSKNQLSQTIKVLKEEQLSIQNKVFSLEEQQVEMSKEKEELLRQFEHIQLEKSVQNQQNYEALSIDYELLKAKCDQYKNYLQNNEKNQLDIEIKLQELAGTSKTISENYAVFRQKYQAYKGQVEVLLKDRNSVEVALTNLSDKLSILQSNSRFVTEEVYKSHFEKKAALEIIINDLQKQFSRCSKIVYNICFNLSNVFDLATQKIIAAENLNQDFDQATLNETKQKLEEIKELAEDASKKISSYVVPSEKNAPTNILKESNTNLQSGPTKDLEELRKKFNAMKQKLVLVENAKCNYERKIHLLREENNKLSQHKRPVENLDSEAHYKTLLHQHLQTKEEHETLITECEAKYKQLLKEYENYKREHPRLSESSINQNTSKTLQDRSVKLEREVYKLRDAYGNLMSDKSKLELENITIKKVLDDRNVQIGDLSLIKQAYERLLEDNNKLKTDIDTLHYKKTKDREEFVKILKNEKDEYEKREGNRVQDIRNEYELKLEKMKDKMVKLYKEEVDKEMRKAFSEKSNNTTLLETIDHLRDELTTIQLKLQLVESERIHQPPRINQPRTTTITHHHHHHNHQQIQRASTLSSYRPLTASSDDNLFSSLSGHLMDRGSVVRGGSSKGGGVEQAMVVVDDRRSATLPRQGGGSVDVLQEIRIQKRTSISSAGNGGAPATSSGSQLEMEDEDDMFNNKYLADLKEGRCQSAAGLTNADVNPRLSEFVYRNSLCLPHLKSSYPCETQFASPSVFKEDDIKLGSNTTPPTSTTRHSHLPPPHPQQRLRKDAGTTSYKRPGPPTPSKNGGRASLSSMDRVQGVVAPLREVNDGRASIATSVVQQARNRLTPTRLKTLFSSKGKGNSTTTGGSTSAAEHSTLSDVSELTEPPDLSHM